VKTWWAIGLAGLTVLVSAARADETTWGYRASESKPKNQADAKVTLTAVSGGKLAYLLGLRQGDTFENITVDGKAYSIRTKADLNKALAAARVKESTPITLVVWRQKSPQEQAAQKVTLDKVLKQPKGKKGQFYVMDAKKTK
jgi:hypothetical protein